MQEFAHVEFKRPRVKAGRLELLNEIAVLFDEPAEGVVHQTARRFVAWRRLHKFVGRMQLLLPYGRIEQPAFVGHDHSAPCMPVAPADYRKFLACTFSVSM